MVVVPQQPAPRAHLRLELVAGDHQPLEDEHRGAVPDEAVAFHLPQPKPPVPRPPLRGLPGEHHPGPPRSGVHLIEDHVLELLVIHRPHEDVRDQGLPRDAAVHQVFPVVREPVRDERLRDGAHGVPAERGAVVEPPVLEPGFASQQLDHLPDGHSAREPVRVHDEVRDDAAFAEWEIALREHRPDDALLPVSARELIPHLGPPRVPDEALHVELPLVRHREHHLIHDARLPLGALVALRRRAEEAVRHRLRVRQRVARVGRRLLVHVHVPRGDPLPHRRDPVLVQQTVPPVRAQLRLARRDDSIRRSVGIFFNLRAVLAKDDAPPEPAVQRRLVHHERVLDVVPAVTHHRHRGVLTRAQPVVPDQLDRLGLHDRLLRVHEKVHQRVHAVELVKRDVAHRLLPHRALVRVPRGLVVVRVRNHTRAHAEERERLDLQVRVLLGDLALVQSDERVVLLVHVQILHRPRPQKVAKRQATGFQLAQLLARHSRASALANQQRTTHPPAVARDGHPPGLRVHGDELAHASAASERPEVPREPSRVRVRAEDGPVEQHQRGAGGVKLAAGEMGQRLDAQRVRQRANRLLLVVRGDVRHEGEVFHEAARLPLRGVARAQHPPLARLQRPGARDFARLLKLARDARHHPERGDERETAQDLRHALALHPEPLHRPVSAADGVLEAVGERVLADALEDVELRRAVRLAQHRVRLALQIGVQALEAVLEQQRQELPRELQSLVPVVVLVVHLRAVRHRVEDPANHHAHVRPLGPEIVTRHRHVRENHPGQDIPRLVHAVALGPRVRPHPRRGSNLGAAILERLPRGEDAVRRALLHARREQARVRGIRSDELHHLLVRLQTHRLQGDDDGDLVREGVVPEVELPVLHRDVGLALAFVRRARDARAHLALGVDVDDDAVLAELLLDQDDLLRALDDEVPARVQRALAEPRELVLGFSRQDAPGAPEHERDAPDGDAADARLARPRDDLLPSGVLDVDGDGRGVRHVAQAALLRGDVLDDVVLLHARFADVDVRVLEVEVRVGVARDLLVRLGSDDLPDLLVDEVIERVDVLPDQAADLEERGEELVLILQRLHRRRERRGVAGEASVQRGIARRPEGGRDPATRVEGAEAHLPRRVRDAVVRHRPRTDGARTRPNERDEGSRTRRARPGWDERDGPARRRRPRVSRIRPFPKKRVGGPARRARRERVRDALERARTARRPGASDRPGGRLCGEPRRPLERWPRGRAVEDALHRVDASARRRRRRGRNEGCVVLKTQRAASQPRTAGRRCFSLHHQRA